MASPSTLNDPHGAARDRPWGGSNAEIRQAVRLSFGSDKLSSAPNGHLSALILLRTFAVIGGAIALLAHYGPAIWPVSLLLIGVSQYHLSVAVHEASHFGLFRTRRLNEFVATLIGSTIGFDLASYRRHHWSHHRSFGSPADPDYALYAGRYRSWTGLAMDMVSKFTLYGLVRRIARALLPSIRSGAREAFGKSNPYAHPVSFALSQVPLIGLFTWARAWWAYPVFWLLPLVILPGLLNGLRMLGEHGGLTRREGPQVLSARTTMGSVGRSSALARLERVILSPFNFNLHHEHHLFPQLPYHVLPGLHNHLLSSGYYAAHPDVLSPSYANTFRKLVGGKSVTAR